MPNAIYLKYFILEKADLCVMIKTIVNKFASNPQEQD